MMSCASAVYCSKGNMPALLNILTWLTSGASSQNLDAQVSEVLIFLNMGKMLKPMVTIVKIRSYLTQL